LAKLIFVWKRHILWPPWDGRAGPQGQDRMFIEERRQNPLMAEDISQVLGMILMPGAAGDLFPRFLDNRVVQEKKDDGRGLNLEGMKEFVDRHSQDFIQGPGFFPRNRVKLLRDRARKERDRDWTMEEVCPSFPS